MKTLGELVRNQIALREEHGTPLTLLAACPNSETVLEAAVLTASRNNAPMLFAATLNQVDRDGGYTGWTQSDFVKTMQRFAGKYNWSGPLYPCLDHGGPWLKDRHTRDKLNLAETIEEVKRSLAASLEAGYRLLHVDPTVDRTLPLDRPVPIDLVLDRTIELIGYAECERKRLGLPAIDYEVGTEEVHGGLVDFDNFKRFVTGLHKGLGERGLLHAWPCFIVAKVGTDLHTTCFDPEIARRIYDIVAPLGSLVKGHYTDWVENPDSYPWAGLGGANVGPEFTAEEYCALSDLASKEKTLCRYRPEVEPSGFLQVLEDAVVRSGRWEKWLQMDEMGRDFDELTPERRLWLVQTGARYIWTTPPVIAARQKLYDNLKVVMPDPHQYVVERIADSIDRYINAFNLFDSLTLFEGSLAYGPA
jgi:D-tagatose-1,6-bisphosphate aldolase subunit GatZ/KbaZ